MRNSVTSQKPEGFFFLFFFLFAPEEGVIHGNMGTKIKHWGWALTVSVIRQHREAFLPAQCAF